MLPRTKPVLLRHTGTSSTLPSPGSLYSAAIISVARDAILRQLRKQSIYATSNSTSCCSGMFYHIPPLSRGKSSTPWSQKVAARSNQATTKDTHTHVRDIMCVRHHVCETQVK